MGPQINYGHYEYCPFVSKDGRYLFFTRHQDIFWVSAELIEALMPTWEWSISSTLWLGLLTDSGGHDFRQNR